MISGSKLMLAAASTLAIAVPAMPASAKTIFIYGAGSSLIAPYIRQAGDCYSNNLPLIFKGTPPTLLNEPGFDFTGSPPQDCSHDAQDYIQNRALDYISTGSGTGIQGFFSHDPSKYGDTDPVTTGNQYFPTTNYDLSDTSLGAGEVTIYNNGGTNSTVGVTVVAPGVTPGAGQYQNPKEHYGSMIQFPLLVAPVAIGFDPIYKKVRNASDGIDEYAFNLFYPRDGGGLRLDTAAMCDIFNGITTDWNDSSLMILNNNTSLQDPSDTGAFSVPLQIVGREDSSGTTSIFSRYMANVCSGRTGNSYANSHSRLPGTYTDSTGATQTTEIAPGGKDLAGVVYFKANPNTAPAGETLGVFTLANGNDGVAKYLDFTIEPVHTTGDTVVQGRMGYVGPDYVLPAVNNTGANGYNLFSADVKNSSGSFIAPTPTAARAAYSNISAPETDVHGNYSPNSTCGTMGETGKCRANPQDWVQAADKTVPIANPSGAASYPIVGTTNYLGYTCYNAKNVTAAVKSFFKFYLASPTISDPNLGLLVSSGFAPLSSQFIKAIKATFFTSSSLHLDIAQGGTSPQCTAVVGG